jgi:hypothetical protein
MYYCWLIFGDTVVAHPPRALACAQEMRADTIDAQLLEAEEDAEKAELDEVARELDGGEEGPTEGIFDADPVAAPAT